MSSKLSFVLTAIVILFVVGFLIAISIPSLLRARVSTELARSQPPYRQSTEGRAFVSANQVDPLDQGRDGRERGNTERYSRIHDNPFLDAADAPLSTFAIDVDTASYANVRRLLRDGHLPPPDAVRIEELVNYFRFDYPEPQGDEPFSVTTEVGDCPWKRGHKLLLVGLKGRAVEQEALPPRNLVFLIDVSGSMDEPLKLPLLVSAMNLLVDQLTERDRVAMVVYAGSAGLVLPPTLGSKKDTIREALSRLAAGGSTAGGEGIVLAYELAERGYLANGINRVILATDGDFNVGVTSEGDLTRLIEKKRKTGVFLSVLGFGAGNLNDSAMEKIADAGNGNYSYIDSLSEARKVLVKEGGATLVTLAKDVKIQVEFNPAQVAAYRLIGYENRLLAAEDFNDDRKDAGEIGAGHSVTALYEWMPATGESRPGRVDPLKYQEARKASADAGSEELVTVKLRYQPPAGGASALMTVAVAAPAKTGASEASENMRWAASVASFGMLLRDSEHKGDASYALVQELARGSLGTDREGYRKEFVEIVDRARALAAEAARESVH